MSDRPKAAAGMLWLPVGPYGSTRNEGLAVGTAGRAAWVSPALVQRVWSSEVMVRETPTEYVVRAGTIVETLDARAFYEIDTAAFLETLAEAWAQRGGRS